MTIRSRLLALLARGRPASDPDDFVEFLVVRAADGPLLETRLNSAGIETRGDLAFNVATSALSDYRIMVRRRDLTDALALDG